MVKVAVLGAGIAGLTSAINVQRQMPEAEVTVIADKFGSGTTSDGAGGFFRPYMPDIYHDGLDPKVADQWVKDSWHFYNGLARSALAEESGQALVPGIAVYYEEKGKGYDLLKTLVPDFREVSPRQLKEMNLARYKYGYAFTTVVSQSSKFLRWLMFKFREAGGKVLEKTVHNLTELQPSYDIVVNCCGLRGEVSGDSSCFPIKGQLVHLDCPWQKCFFFADDNIYMIPHDNKLIVGGVRMRGNNVKEVDPDIRDRILTRAQELHPQIKGAKVIGDWVGLRPGRKSGVRLETEILKCGNGKSLTVIHNYGHAGHGITLGWGCGKHAAGLVKQAAYSNKARL